jgi:hypothetical protein
VSEVAAKLEPISTEIEEAEFLLTARKHEPERGETYLTGMARGFALALVRARGLALSGWKVRIESADPNNWDEPVHTVEPRQ